MTTCKNCETKFIGKYCGNCRQPADTERITWHELGHQIPHALLHVDRGLFYTIKELTVRPGHSLREYLQGKRVYHFNPFLFLILVGGLTSLLYVSLHLSPPNEEIKLERIQAFSGTLAYKYFALVGLVFIILLSVTDYFFHISEKYNLPELIISNTFQVAQIMVFTLAAVPLLLLQNYIVQESGLHLESRLGIRIAMVFYLFFVRYQFHRAAGNYKLILKILVQLTVVYLLYNLTIPRLISNAFQ